MEKVSLYAIWCQVFISQSVAILTLSSRIVTSNSLIINFILLAQYINKKDGYRQRNVRQFLHILASLGYAPGTIAVNVTCMESGFNAGQTHSSIPIFNRLQAIARLVGNCNFFLPLAFNVTGVFPLDFRGKVWSSEN